VQDSGNHDADREQDQEADEFHPNHISLLLDCVARSSLRLSRAYNVSNRADTRNYTRALGEIVRKSPQNKPSQSAADQCVTKTHDEITEVSSSSRNLRLRDLKSRRING